MKSNMGSLDRIVRFIAAVIIAILLFANVLTGGLGVILAIIAIILVVTSIVGFCPLYVLFKMSTKKQ